MLHSQKFDGDSDFPKFSWAYLDFAVLDDSPICQFIIVMHYLLPIENTGTGIFLKFSIDMLLQEFSHCDFTAHWYFQRPLSAFDRDVEV